jgi:hypothetical protein
VAQGASLQLLTPIPPLWGPGEKRSSCNLGARMGAHWQPAFMNRKQPCVFPSDIVQALSRQLDSPSTAPHPR